MIPKRMSGSFLATLRYDPKYERSELVHSVGIVPRLTPAVRPLIRMSAGKAWFHTPRLCRGTGSRSSDSRSRALPWSMILFIEELGAGVLNSFVVKFCRHRGRVMSYV